MSLLPLPSQEWLDFASGRITFLEFRERLNAAMDRDAQASAPVSLTGVGIEPLRSLFVPSHFMGSSYLKQLDRADWQYAHSGLALWASRFLLEMKRGGLPLYVHAAFRTRTEQELVFRKGHSKARWPRAAHCQGKAVDIVHGVKHWDLTGPQWLALGKLGKLVHERVNAQLPGSARFGLTWGGDWRSRPTDIVGWDPAHWEVTDWRNDIRELHSSQPVRLTPAKIIKAGV